MLIRGRSPTTLSTVGNVSLLAVIYYIAAKLSLVFAIPPGFATAVWPPSGIALAAVLLLGIRMWPGIWLGAALANLSAGAPALAAVFIASGNTVEALIGAILIRRYIGNLHRFERGADVVKFVVLAAASAIFAASVGASAIALDRSLTVEQFIANWWTWWQGDTTGIILVTPLILSWAAWKGASWTRAAKIEAVCCGVLLLGVSYMIFGQSNHGQWLSSLSFAILPLIVWVAFRYGEREVTTVAAVVCAIAVKYTVEGGGPFARETLNESLLLLLAFTSTIVITGLMLSAVLAERRAAVDRLAQVLQSLQAQTITDSLTGIYNRRFLDESLPRELARARRRGAALSLIMIDLDNFKLINDSFGHETGDLLLREIAALFKRHIRGSDIACRYGGEEFTLVLPDTLAKGALHRAEELRKAIGQLALQCSGNPISVTASLGIAVFPEHAGSAAGLLRVADRALYAAKEAGRDCVVFGPAPAAPGSQGGPYIEAPKFAGAARFLMTRNKQGD